MPAAPAKFTWYELMTSDTKAAGDFYSTVVGWTTRDAGPGMDYTLFLPKDAGDAGVGGMLPLPEGAKPGWIGYLTVEDVDAMVERVKAAGGSVHKPPTDVPGMLRFAVVADPQGTPFTLMTPLPPMAGKEMPTVAPNTPGHVGWHELVSTDWEASWAFYSGLFGWTKTEAMDMGPMGTYQIFATGGGPVGAMMTGPAGSPAPFWNYYFNVDSIDAAIARLTPAGGKVLMGPQEVPGPMWIVQGVDPQGAMFSLVSGKP